MKEAGIVDVNVQSEFENTFSGALGNPACFIVFKCAPTDPKPQLIEFVPPKPYFRLKCVHSIRDMITGIMHEWPHRIPTGKGSGMVDKNFQKPKPNSIFTVTKPTIIIEHGED